MESQNFNNRFLAIGSPHLLIPVGTGNSVVKCHGLKLKNHLTVQLSDGSSAVLVTIVK